MIRALYLPDSIELYKIRFHRNSGEVAGEKFAGAQQFGTVMVGLGRAVAFEMSQSAVGSAVGVAHDQDALRLVQADGHADLLEDEVLLEVVARGSQGLGSSGYYDHVSALDGLLLQELSHDGADAVIEAAEHGGIGDVWVGGRIEMEDLAHESPSRVVVQFE
jgi:hypothetical protein